MLAAGPTWASSSAIPAPPMKGAYPLRKEGRKGQRLRPVLRGPSPQAPAVPDERRHGEGEVAKRFSFPPGLSNGEDLVYFSKVFFAARGYFLARPAS